jgi:hypothetical protein
VQEAVEEVASRSELGLGAILGELVLGIAVGVVIPYVALRLERTRFFGSS